MEKTTCQEHLCSVLLTKYHAGDQVKKTEMGRTCSTYGGEERCNLKEGNHLENTGVDGTIVLNWIFEMLEGGHTLD